MPSTRWRAQPPLGATRFLVDAATATSARIDPPSRRGVVDRLVWTAELFARLEQRDRFQAAGGRPP